MVVTHFFDESTGLPAAHPRGSNRDPVNATALHFKIAADFLETLAAEELAGSGDMFHVGESEVVTSGSLYERRSSYTETPVGRHLGHQKLEIIRLECDIGVQVANDVERPAPQFF